MAQNIDCPHCGRGISISYQKKNVGYAKGIHFEAYFARCPSCDENIIELYRYTQLMGASAKDCGIEIVWPKAPFLKKSTTDVKKRYRELYNEAQMVIPISPKASAALSRRCLQDIIENELEVEPGDLSVEIKKAKKHELISSTVGKLMDDIRHVGNFSTHPKKDTNTREIIDVEPEEAQYLIDVLGEVFEDVFIKPAQRKKIQKSIQGKIRKSTPAKPQKKNKEVLEEKPKRRF